jgi:hypothetical protein
LKVALYIGAHKGAPWNVRLACWLIRFVQKGALGNVTHVEAILAEHADGSVDIASSVALEGGVRIKRCVLDPAQWRVVDVPEWDAAKARAWFEQHAGEPYDWRGAFATLLPGHDSRGWFCNEAVGASVGLVEPHTFTPSTFAAVCLTFGREVFFTDAL